MAAINENVTKNQHENILNLITQLVTEVNDTEAVNGRLMLQVQQPNKTIPAGKEYSEQLYSF